jgi:hypothetical protein
VKKIYNIAILLLLLFSKSNIIAQNLKPNLNWWLPNGEVKSMVADSNNLYIGGSFSSVSPNVRYAAKFDTINPAPILGFNNKINPDGFVYSVLKDGNGGWFLGGKFTKIGNENRNNIAWIDKDGNLKSWNPEIDDTVFTLVIKDNVLYVGGMFNYVNNISRRHFAAFNLSTGVLLDLQAMTNGPVYTILADSNKLLLGGNFNYCADTKNRFDLSWDLNNKNNPNYNSVTPNGKVLSSCPDGYGGWYIAGEFTQVGNTNRQYLARINSNGTLHPWNPPAPSSIVQSIVNIDSVIYISGNFYNVGDSSRYGTAAIDVKGNNIYSGFNSRATSIKLYRDKNYIYCYGNGFFNRYDTKNPSKDFSINAQHVFGWMNNKPYLIDPFSVYSMCVVDTFILVCGDFNWVNGNQVFGSNAVFSSNNGKCLTNFNINSDQKINDFAFDGNNIIAIGDFKVFAGQNIQRIAKISYPSFTSSSTNLTFNGVPNNVFCTSSNIYIIGDFDTVSNIKHEGIVELDINSGNITSWTPITSFRLVKTISQSSNKLYVGGDLLTEIRKQTRNFAVYNVLKKQFDPFVLNINAPVNSFKIDANELYIGGHFTKINDSICVGFGTLNKSTYLPIKGSNELDIASFGTNGGVYSIETDKNFIYLGGNFQVPYNNLYYFGILPVNKSTKKIIIPTKQMGTGYTIQKLKIINNVLYACGCTYDQSSNPIFGIFKIDKESIDIVWQNESNSFVRDFDINGSELFTGGEFTSVYTQLRNNAFAINFKTGQLTNWNPNVDGKVNTLLVSNNNVYLGGKFNNVGGQARSNLASVSSIDASPQAWRPNPNNEVITMAKSNDTLYVGGSFSSIGGASRNNFASLDIATSYALNWNPNPDAKVTSILPFGNNVYIGGAFQTIAGQNRNFIAKFKVDGTLMPWNAYAYKYIPGSVWGVPARVKSNLGSINDMVMFGNNLFVAGDVNIFNFTNAGSFIKPNDVYDERFGLAQIDATTGSATSWNANLSSESSVNSILVKDSFLFAGGSLDMYDEPKRPFLTSLYLKDSKVGNWLTNPDNNINKLYKVSNNIVVGGMFNNISDNNLHFLAAYSAPYPTITSFYPQIAGQNDTVDIYGDHFTGTQKVKFGNTEAVSFKVISDNHIMSIVGTGSTGEVTVETNLGSASKSLFTFKNNSNIVSNDFSSSISIYPNPFETELKINVSNNDDFNSFNIYSIFGVKLLNGKLHQSLNTINLDGLESGVYIIQIEGNKNLSMKIVKQ